MNPTPRCTHLQTRKDQLDRDIAVITKRLNETDPTNYDRIDRLETALADLKPIRTELGKELKKC